MRVALPILFFASAAQADESEIFDPHPDKMTPRCQHLQCTEANLRKALDVANGAAADCDTALCGQGECVGDNINLPLEVLCAVSLYARENPLQFAADHAEEVLCCKQLGANAEISAFRIWNCEMEFGGGEGEGPECFNRRQLDSTFDPKEKSSYTSDSWEGQVTLDQLWTRATGSSHRKMGMSRILQKTNRCRAPDSDSDSETSDTNSDDECGPSYDCNDFWQLRKDLLSNFDMSPGGNGLTAFCRPGECRQFPVYTTMPISTFDAEHRRRRTVSTESKLPSGSYEEDLCYAGMLYRLETSFQIALASLGGQLRCCADAYNDNFNRNFLADGTQSLYNRRRRNLM